MANTDAPFGLRPVKHLDGSPYNGAYNRYYVPTSETNNIFIGDPVGVGGSADADGVPDVTRSAVNTAILGVVVGIEPVNSESALYRAASAEAYVYVADAPDLVFEIQEDSTGGAIAATSVGLNADIAITAGSTAAARSNIELDSSDVKTGTAQLRILGLAQRADNSIGTNANWLVMINEHALKTTTGV